MDSNLATEERVKAEFSRLQRMFTKKDTEYLTHNLHDFPGKFIPQFPSTVLKIVKDYDDINFRSDHSSVNVLDPFCGVGTTLVEACKSGLTCVGIDIDPIAYLASKVSTSPIDPKKLNQYTIALLKALRRKFTAEEWKQKPIPENDIFPNAVPLWFREETFKQLSLIRDTIFGFEFSQEVQDLALLSLSAIVKPVSNADPRDIFPERDLSNPIREKKDVLTEFSQSLKVRADKVSQFSRKVKGRRLASIYDADAKSIPLNSETVDLTLTSPPYAYALEYARVHQLSTLLFIVPNQKLRELRRQYIGTDRVSIRQDIGSFEGFEFIEQRVKEISDENKKVGIVIYNYLKGMYEVISEISRVLKMRGIFSMVIGNSTIRGTDFKTSDVLGKMCERHGLSIYREIERPYYAYRLPRTRAPQSDRIQADIFIFARKLQQE